MVFSINKTDPGSFTYYVPRIDFFGDKMVLPGYFKDQFLDTFGPFAYVFDHCGIYYADVFPQVDHRRCGHDNTPLGDY